MPLSDTTHTLSVRGSSVSSLNPSGAGDVRLSPIRDRFELPGSTPTSPKFSRQKGGQVTSLSEEDEGDESGEETPLKGKGAVPKGPGGMNPNSAQRTVIPAAVMIREW
jgi:hypothetical protein